MDINRQSATI